MNPLLLILPLTLACSAEITDAASNVPTSLCGDPAHYWAAPDDQGGAAWVEGEGGVALAGESTCSPAQCLDIEPGQAFVFIRDPLGAGEAFFEEGIVCP